MTFKRFCCDLAIMEYGPAVQMSIGSVILSDLQHVCKSGEFVQLFSITSNCLVQESINLLYRKVLKIFFMYNSFRYKILQLNTFIFR